MKFQKTEPRFCKWKSNYYNDINIFMPLKNPCTYLLAEEKTWKCICNTKSELLQNCSEKQIMPFKTTANELFNDILCYLVIDSFDWKISIFEQAVVVVYYVLNNANVVPIRKEMKWNYFIRPSICGLYEGYLRMIIKYSIWFCISSVS